MGSQIFLGKPPANIEQWIKDHHGPVVRETTLITTVEDGQQEFEISGQLTNNWLASNGFRDPDVPIWYKTVTSIEVGTDVTSIGYEAFWNSHATTITLPSTVSSIGYHALGGNNFTSFTLPNSITCISDYMFAECSSLSSIVVPDNIVTIGNEAFNYCGSLESITLPDSVASIGNYAFAYCSRLASITLPDSVASIGAGVFLDCPSIASVTITANGGNAQNVKNRLITEGVPSDITWNMPS